MMESSSRSIILTNCVSARLMISAIIWKEENLGTRSPAPDQLSVAAARKAAEKGGGGENIYGQSMYWVRDSPLRLMLVPQWKSSANGGQLLLVRAIHQVDTRRSAHHKTDAPLSNHVVSPKTFGRGSFTHCRGNDYMDAFSADHSGPNCSGILEKYRWNDTKKYWNSGKFFLAVRSHTYVLSICFW